MKRSAVAVVTIVLICGFANRFQAQAPAVVDFARDVQPIFREHCYECHGPDQQMNGFRLDRRADAMRGGSQSVIGPGNADGSRMYRRLIGSSVGTQMPPAGALKADQVAVIKAWIDRGAVWPDALSGAVAVPSVNPDAERLVGLLRDNNHAGVDRLLQSNPRSAQGRAAGGSTPLMFAALYGDITVMRRLLAAGSPAGATNAVGATALMWAVPDVDKMRLLVEAGADVNARSEDGRTALTVAAGSIGSAGAVKMLLEYGANPLPFATSDPSPVREAARIGNVDAFRLLIAYGASRSTVPAAVLRTTCFACAEAIGVGGDGPLPLAPPLDRRLKPTDIPASASRSLGAVSVTRATIHAAVDRALPLLQKIDQPFINKTGCVSCHHNSLVALAVSTARRNGYHVDEKMAADGRRTLAEYLESWRESTLQNRGIAGNQDTISYLLFGLAAEKHPADRATDAQALWLLRRQAADGRWPLNTLRPPIESNDIEVTALSMRGLQVYAPPAQAAKYTQAVERARDWLASARGITTEEQAFRLLGLTWAGASRDLVAAAANDLLASQRADGGWSQEPSMESDAYATGEALVALSESGIGAQGDQARARAVAFLLRTQFDDGSWLVKSRAVPIQVYFESGFPHGADQWISAAGTAWAVSALASQR